MKSQIPTKLCCNGKSFEVIFLIVHTFYRGDSVKLYLTYIIQFFIIVCFCSIPQNRGLQQQDQLKFCKYHEEAFFVFVLDDGWGLKMSGLWRCTQNYPHQIQDEIAVTMDESGVLGRLLSQGVITN